jgi:hypothetical protein
VGRGLSLLGSFKKSKLGILELGFSVLVLSFYLVGLMMVNYEVNRILEELIKRVVSI